MKWYTYLAIKHLFPSGRPPTFFSIMSICGVAIGVMVLFVVHGVMNGFQERIKDTIVATQGDVRISSPHIIYDVNDIDALLSESCDVDSFAKFAYGMTMLQFDNRPVFPMMKGIDLAHEREVIGLDKFICSGNINDLSDDGIVLSKSLADSIGIQIGDIVDVYSPIMFLEQTEDTVMLPRSLEVVAIYETGYHQIDNDTAMVSLSTMQELYGLCHGIHGVSIKLKNSVSAERFAHELTQILPFPLVANSWREMNADFLFALKTEKTMMNFVLMFIIVVAAFSMTSSMTIFVVKKTREIGLMSALGGSSRGSAICFAIQSMLIGGIGSIIGIISGIIILHFRNHIVRLFVHLCGINDFMLKFYSFADMPASYSWQNIVFIMLFAIGMCILSGMIPACRASKINPAEALRNE